MCGALEEGGGKRNQKFKEERGGDRGGQEDKRQEEKTETRGAQRRERGVLCLIDASGLVSADHHHVLRRCETLLVSMTGDVTHG